MKRYSFNEQKKKTRSKLNLPLTERDRLGLRGLRPPHVISFEQVKFEFLL
ncbi:unnamed protein product [Brassica oleracea]